jgi:hypothetical protein
MGDQPVARPLPAYRRAQTQNKRTQTSMPRVAIEPTILVFERVKTVHATVIYISRSQYVKKITDATGTIHQNLMMMTEMFHETSVTFNQPTRLIAWENFVVVYSSDKRAKAYSNPEHAWCVQILRTSIALIIKIQKSLETRWCRDVTKWPMTEEEKAMLNMRERTIQKNWHTQTERRSHKPQKLGTDT